MVPQENDETDTDLNTKIGKRHDETNSLKSVLQRTVENTTKNSLIISVILIVLVTAFVILILPQYFFSHTTEYALRSSYDLENIEGEKITTSVYWYV